MSTQTHETMNTTPQAYEPHPQDVDFLSIVKGLSDLEEQSASIEREVLASAMAKNPELYMPTQFEQLSELYRERSERQTFHWSKHIEEATMFASRTLDCSRLEEVYLIFDDFGPHNRSWQTRQYIARIKLDDQGSERLLHLDETGSFDVKERHASERDWRVLSGEAAEQATVDFFRESLRAVGEQLQRSDEERQSADDDALEKLMHEYYPGMPTRRRRA